jgi:ATP-dependent RNA helicase DDX52/ROK1
MLSSDKSKDERQKILSNFDLGKYWFLITTDIVARGIDFKNVNIVINYDFPNSMLTYIHRVGRTARADRKGSAVTFFTDEDKPLVRSLANLLRASGCEVPEWIAEMPKAKK